MQILNKYFKFYAVMTIHLNINLISEPVRQEAGVFRVDADRAWEAFFCFGPSEKDLKCLLRTYFSLLELKCLLKTYFTLLELLEKDFFLCFEKYLKCFVNNKTNCYITLLRPSDWDFFKYFCNFTLVRQRF